MNRRGFFGRLAAALGIAAVAKVPEPKHRLVLTWRDRIVLGGELGDPHNWFMTRADQAAWDYGNLDLLGGSSS